MLVGVPLVAAGPAAAADAFTSVDDRATPEGIRRLTTEYPVEMIVLGVLSEAGDLINLQARLVDVATFDTLGVVSVNVANAARAKRFLEAGRE